MHKKEIIEENKEKIAEHFKTNSHPILFPYRDEQLSVGWSSVGSFPSSWGSHSYKSEYITYEDWIEFNKLEEFNKDFEDLIK